MEVLYRVPENVWLQEKCFSSVLNLMQEQIVDEINF
jgi:hypothetical protein